MKGPNSNSVSASALASASTVDSMHLLPMSASCSKTSHFQTRSRRAWWRYRVKIAAIVAILAILETSIHVRNLTVHRPATNLDPPFYVGCQEPVLNGSSRANAAIVMLARNSDVEDAIRSVRSLQEQFNRHFSYPWVFLNNEDFTPEFVTKVGAAVAEDGAGTKATFETIPPTMWGFPNWIDPAEARKAMNILESKHVFHGGKESYHHMCRFYSGFFYDHPALAKYKWYWRVEPHVSFTCAITYDPFVEMRRHNKRYGYTLALWELRNTAQSLFYKISQYKNDHKIAATSLWKAMITPSYLPWPLRPLMGWKPNRAPSGDSWDMCHFWSNFEIADMDFFRSRAYRDLFQFLDDDGGMYAERWGDAPIHSLAAALLLQPEQVHHFSDFGYAHEPFQYCTYAPTEESLRRGELVPDTSRLQVKDIVEKELGCRCKCDPSIERIGSTCFNRMRSAVM